MAAVIAARIRIAQEQRSDAIKASTRAVRCLNAVLLNGMGRNTPADCFEQLDQIREKLSK
jgi:hypothetical protein